MAPSRKDVLLLAAACLLLFRISAAQGQPPSEPDNPEETPQPLVPAFFIYGDSTVDVGNNNYLVTVARADMAPYGKDFDTHKPTGRFSNGRLSIDHLAIQLGLPFPPPYLSKVNVTTMKGVNFASAGAGIFSETGNDLGDHIAFSEQIHQMSVLKGQFAFIQGRDAAESLMSKAIHYISIGSNDFIHYYFRNVSGVKDKFTPLEFNDLLILTLTSQLKELYRLGARKMVVVGLGPLGCAPNYLFRAGSSTGKCIQELNFMIKEYNSALRVKIAELFQGHADLVITFCDVYNALNPILQHPKVYGFATVSMACCGVGRYGGLLMCMTPAEVCEHPDIYVWWDQFHPTAKVNHLLAKAVWAGDGFNLCYDLTLQHVALAVPDCDFCSANPDDPKCTPDGQNPTAPHAREF